ncbi:MAG TPA: N-acetylmuramidase family protein [Polyangiales bacterium]
MPLAASSSDQDAWFNAEFMQGTKPALGLSDQDYQDAATQLDVNVAAIRAVAEVETMGNAFDAAARPTILFERHHFHRHTGGKHDATHPSISSELAGGYGKFNAQYDKLRQAYALDPEAALKSASWGRFQIMGSNHAACGFDSVRSFVLAMSRSEAAHLSAFVSFVASHKLRLEALRDQDWASFAKLYNGAGYAKRGYHTKMQHAFEAIVAAQAPAAAGGVG